MEPKHLHLNNKVGEIFRVNKGKTRFPKINNLKKGYQTEAKAICSLHSYVPCACYYTQSDPEAKKIVDKPATPI